MPGAEAAGSGTAAGQPGMPGPSVPAARCLVTGGSGFLGINLVRHLLARGWRVRVLDRLPFDYPERPAVEAIIGDVRDRIVVRHAMDGVAAVVHAAAALPLAPAQEILSTGIDGTRVVLEEAAARAVARVVFTSSTAVYGIPDHHPLREGDALHGVGPYGRSKIEAEALCEAWRARRLCVPVLRPKTFVGPERLGVFEILYRWAWEGRNFPVLGRGDHPYQLLDVGDLCEAIERCITRPPEAVNATFNIGASRIATMRENVQAVLDRAGRGGRAISLPAGPVVAALRLLHALHLSPLYPWIYETADRESVVAIDRLQAALDFTPRRSNIEALQANYDWFVRHRAELNGQTGITHRRPWNHGALDWVRHCF
jgi:nucleoside-diphosphate-sugar epimerase